MFTTESVKYDKVKDLSKKMALKKVIFHYEAEKKGA